MKEKKCLYKIAISLFLIILSFSCENLGEEIKDELSSNYRFYAEENGSVYIDSTYQIGKSYSIDELFPEANDGSGSLKPGYYATGWLYWKNPDSSSSNTDEEEEIPSTITFDSNNLVTKVTVVPQDAYFYANSWKPITYSVNFDANGGSGSMTSLTCEYDQTYTLPENTFTRSGYKFKGWLTDSSSTDIAYSDGASFINWFSVQGNSRTLYASWLPETCCIYFYAGSYDGAASVTQEVNTEEQITLNANTFTQDGYTFIGWGDYSGNYLYYDRQVVTLYGDLSLYALWQSWGRMDNYFSSNGTTIIWGANGSGVNLAASSSYSSYEWIIKDTGESLGTTSSSDEYVEISYNSHENGTYNVICYVYDSSGSIADLCAITVVIAVP